MNDKWNPRLWLREWLNKPSPSERKKERRIDTATAARMRESVHKEREDRLNSSITYLAN
ncbi:TPA: hypothetical protein ACKQCJ_000543 [Stenotrophomonas maltophilia]